MRKQSMKLVQVSLLVIAAIYLGGCSDPDFPFFDDFSASTLSPRYREWDEDVNDTCTPVNEKLEIRVAENQDLWGIPMGGEGPPKRGAPLLLINAPAGEYRAEALVTATNTDSPGGPQALNTQVGLFVFRDEENWLFFGFTNLDFTDIDGNKPEFDGLMLTNTTDGKSSVVQEWKMENMDSAYLRITRTETIINFDYRPVDDDSWKTFGSTGFVPIQGTEEVGMGVKTFDFRDTLTSNVSNWGLGLFDNFRVDTY